MKIIFLDIDGVLCTRRSHLALGREGGIWYEWDPLACHVVKSALGDSTRIKLVISSTWRLPKNEPELHAQLAKYGFAEINLVLPDWKTDHLPDEERGVEIQSWLDRHPEVKDYRILDDNSNMLDRQMDKLILTDTEEGMTSDNIKKLLNWAGVWKA